MIKYLEKLQDFYKMRDTLITEGYSDIENIKIYDKVELREISLEIIKEKGIDIIALKECKKAKTYNENTKRTYCEEYTEEEFNLLKEVML